MPPRETILAQGPCARLNDMTRLSTNLRDPSARPYFLWDEDTTVAELRSAIEHAEPAEWARLVGTCARRATRTCGTS